MSTGTRYDGSGLKRIGTYDISNFWVSAVGLKQTESWMSGTNHSALCSGFPKLAFRLELHCYFFLIRNSFHSDDTFPMLIHTGRICLNSGSGWTTDSGQKPRLRQRWLIAMWEIQIRVSTPDPYKERSMVFNQHYKANCNNLIYLKETDLAVTICENIFHSPNFCTKPNLPIIF